MPSFKQPTFQERVSLAAKAKTSALEKLRAKPPVDEAVLAERRAASLAKEAAQAQAREAKRIAHELEKAEKKARAEEAALAAAVAAPAVLTDEEKKIARDARYAARKGRVGKR